MSFFSTHPEKEELRDFGSLLRKDSWVTETTDVLQHFETARTAQKMKFSNKYFFSKCDQIRSFLWILSHLLKKFLM